jgi:hypothetical protein
MTTEFQRMASGLAGARSPRAVEDGRPPRQVVRIINPIICALLRTPLHPLLSRQLTLLTMRGRKSGRWVTVPVGRHQIDGTLFVSVSGRWRYNLSGGSPVRVVLDGRDHLGYAEVVDDPEQVAQIFKMLIDRVGARGAALLGMKLNVKRLPTAGEIRPVVATRWIARVRLAERPSISGG